MAQFNFL